MNRRVRRSRVLQIEEEEKVTQLEKNKQSKRAFYLAQGTSVFD